MRCCYLSCFSRGIGAVGDRGCLLINAQLDVNVGVKRPEKNQRFATPETGFLAVLGSLRPESLTNFRPAEIGVERISGRIWPDGILRNATGDPVAVPRYTGDDLGCAAWCIHVGAGNGSVHPLRGASRAEVASASFPGEAHGWRRSSAESV